MDPYKEKNSPPRRRLFKKRWILYTAFFLAGLLAIVDFYFEVFGVPEFVYQVVQDQLQVNGIVFKGERIRGGLVRGITIYNVELRDAEAPEALALTADNIKCRLSVKSLLLDQQVRIDSLRLVDGYLSIPMFPESGEEGLGDCVTVTGLNASIERQDDHLMVNHAEGRVGNIDLVFSGLIKNVFSKRPPGQQGHVPPSIKTGSLARKVQTALVMQIPLETREQLFQVFNKINDEDFATPPSIRVRSRLDVTKLTSSSMQAEVNIPSFSYGYLRVDGINSRLTFSNRIAKLETFHLSLPNEQYVDAVGAFRPEAKQMQGRIFGRALPDTLLLFLDEQSRELLANNGIKLKNMIEFQGSLADYSLESGGYRGKLQVKVPQISYRKVIGTELKASMEFTDLSIIARDVSVNVNGSPMTGWFRLQENSLSAACGGSLPAGTIKQVLPQDYLKRIPQDVTITNKTPIAVDAYLQVTNFSPIKLTGKATIGVPEVTIRKTKLTNNTIRAHFTESTIKVDRFSADLPGKTKFTGSLSAAPGSDTLSLTAKLQGSPREIIKLVDVEAPKLSKQVKGVMTWPKDTTMTELNADIMVQTKPSLNFYVIGNIVMTDFAFRGIPYRYGATRFFYDSDRLLVMPNTLLETDKGQIVMSLAVDLRKRVTWDVQSDWLKPSNRERQEALFAFESTVSGDAVLFTFAPDWTGKILKSPEGAYIRADGIIDFRNETNTKFEVKAVDGMCIWNNVPIRDVRCRVRMDKDILTVDQAHGDAGGGDVYLDYWLHTLRDIGEIDLRVKNVDMTFLSKHLNWKNLTSGEEGNLSGNMKARMVFDDKNDKLYMYGNGDLKIANANLWKVPFFGGLFKMIGDAWSINNYGNISKLECKFDVRKDHVYSDSIQTDGSIVALKGKGKYYWDNSYSDFAVQAQMLKDALPFKAASILLAPVSWLLEARYVGYGQEAKWEQISTIKRIFGTDEN